VRALRDDPRLPILGLSFVLLAISPLQSFREIAFAMAAGLLIPGTR
jgi:hypothetical protein